MMEPGPRRPSYVLHGQFEKDLITLESTSTPSTPFLHPGIGMQTPTMQKKVSMSIFETDRTNMMNQSLNSINNLSEMPMNGRTGNYFEMSDENASRFQSDMMRSTSIVDQSMNQRLAEIPFQNEEILNLSLVDKLRRLSQEVEPYMTDCYPSGNRRNFIIVMAELFYKYNLHDFHRVYGEPAIVDILKFFVGIPLNTSIPVTLKQEKQINHLRSALFKECGFSLEVSVIPVMCFRHKRSIFHLSYSDRSNLPFRLITLLQVKNKKEKHIFLDSNGRVYRDINDWSKHNTLSPSTVYISTVNRTENPGDQTFTLRVFQTPSCQTRKTVFDVMDVAVGIGAVGAGVAACVVTTGGLIIPVLLAGELAASLYMGLRGSMSLVDKIKHKPKKRK